MEEEFDRLIATARFKKQYLAASFNTIQLKSFDCSQKQELLPSRNARLNILKSDEEVDEAKKLTTPKILRRILPGLCGRTCLKVTRRLVLDK